MKSFRAARGCVGVLGTSVFATLLCSISPLLMAQAPTQPPPAQSGSLEAWRASMSRAPLPRKGCFKASYPSTEWQEVPCTTPPSYPLPRTRAGGSNPNTVGGGGSNDFAAQVSGLISTAEGSFMSVTPGISETGADPNTGKTTPNAFTLQLNTNTFTTAVCSSMSCSGWQQFVFENDGNGSATAIAYMQYWLLNYGPNCPAGWYQGGPSAPNDCYKNSANGVGSIPVQTMANLAQLSLTGTASLGGMDTLTMLAPSGDLYAMGSDSLLNLAQGWHAAEFNIFGDGYGTQANFSSGTTIVVKTSVDSGTTSAPSCVAESFTGETDNLTLVPPCCPYGGASPAIEFMESNAASPAATCFSSGLQAFTTLVSFNGTDGENPVAAPVQATDGNLYGTTWNGGTSDLGTVFKTTPAGALTTLYSFCSQGVYPECADGDNPEAGLVQTTNGYLYGTTSGGGAHNGGTVFKITPSGALTTLYSFCAQSNCTDGSYPYAGLVQTTNGYLYGTTSGGGAHNGGTVFKITPSGALTTLYSFCAQSNCTDGSYPYAGLVQATNGYLYGTTSGGGAHNGGTVFKITPSGALTTPYSFCAQSNCTDGSYPYAGLVQATNGYLYGTTSGGGAHNGGTVFKITPSGALTTPYSFCAQSNCTDGSYPYAGLVQATNGYLYGTTSGGGAHNRGTVFKITPSGALTTLHSFCPESGCADGAAPYVGLVQGTDGNFYGITDYGGANACAYGVGGCGTIFRITPSGTLTTLYTFCSQTNCTDGGYPAGLVQATNGDLYGATTEDGTNRGYGTVFGLYVGLTPFVETQPTSGGVGATVKILGTSLTGATGVSFNGAAAVFTVVSPSLITTTVPAGATTGEVQVVTPSGTLSSNLPFRVP